MSRAGVLFADDEDGTTLRIDALPSGAVRLTAEDPNSEECVVFDLVPGDFDQFVIELLKARSA